ncbi:MAG: caspase family protein [Pirellulales bacterium]|nr:caspase family protein [Pirellulales bacterium]
MKSLDLRRSRWASFSGQSVLLGITFLFSNHAPAAEFREWKAAGGHTVRAEFQAAEGDRVVLKREDGTVIKVPKTVFVEEHQRLIAEYERKAQGDKNIQRDRQNVDRFDQGRKWAVVIGVNDYVDPAISDLRYCVADARLVAQTLAGQCGYPADNILTITDDQPKAHQRPLKASLQMQVAEWLKLAEPSDTVVLFFSGHGFLDERGQAFLATQDTQLAHLGLSALRTDELRDMLRQCKASQKLLVLDCCHAGSEKGDDGPGPSSEEIGAAFNKAEGLVTLASCGKQEKSREWEEKGQGLFTYYLAGGLRGPADADRDGYVTSDELYNYVLEGVRTTAQRAFGQAQQPRRIIGEDVVGSFRLARVTVAPAGGSVPPAPVSPRVPPQPPTPPAVTKLQDQLAPFGKVPKPWKLVGELKNDYQEIERENLQIAGDFSLLLAFASATQRCGFAVTLVGTAGGQDVRIEAYKSNSWSGVDDWEFTLPGKSERKGLVPGTRTVTLRREGQVFTLSADQVYNSQKNSPVVAQFVVQQAEQFGAIRLAFSGPTIELKQIRLDPVR